MSANLMVSPEGMRLMHDSERTTEVLGAFEEMLNDHFPRGVQYGLYIIAPGSEGTLTASCAGTCGIDEDELDQLQEKGIENTPFLQAFQALFDVLTRVMHEDGNVDLYRALPRLVLQLADARVVSGRALINSFLEALASHDETQRSTAEPTAGNAGDSDARADQRSD